MCAPPPNYEKGCVLQTQTPASVNVVVIVVVAVVAPSDWVLRVRLCGICDCGGGIRVRPILLFTFVHPLHRALLAVHVHLLALGLLVARVAQRRRDQAGQLHLVLHGRVQAVREERGRGEHFAWAR